ncbi:MAG: hypothetical protein U0I40_01675 [Oscillospiraceae bacterium]|nr:hypothetical protein [Oscillospiraceae bacterium]OLA68687.1 MAG: hypothetical protein BHW52_12085 [Ruminococcus sp. 37_24]
MNLREWIKKPVNTNLTTLLADSAALLAVAMKIYFDYNYYMDSADTAAEIIFGLFIGIGTSFVIFGIIFFAAVIIILAVIARVVYSSENSKRLLAYRIITGICFFIELPVSLMGAVILADTWYVIAAVIFGIASVSAFIIGIRNTYSDRILK